MRNSAKDNHNTINTFLRAFSENAQRRTLAPVFDFALRQTLKYEEIAQNPLVPPQAFLQILSKFGGLPRLLSNPDMGILVGCQCAGGALNPPAIRAPGSGCAPVHPLRTDVRDHSAVHGHRAAGVLDASSDRRLLYVYGANLEA